MPRDPSGANMGWLNNLIDGVGIAQHKTAVESFLKEYVGLELPPSEMDRFTPLIAAGYHDGKSQADIGLKIATAYYANACEGDAQDREAASRIFMKLNMALSIAVVSGVELADVEEMKLVVRHSTQQRLLRSTQLR
jgi:hypothetical protein